MGRGRRLQASAVKTAAQDLSVPILEASDLNDRTFQEQVAALHADIMVVVAFQILPPGIYTLPRLGAFNLHASLLPKYRGAAPIHHALLSGDLETGVTTFLLERRVDTGNILLQQRLPVEEEDNLGSLSLRLAALGAKTVLDTVHGLAQGSLAPLPQTNGLATRAPKVGTVDRTLRFTEPARQCHNRVRAFAPRPGALTQLKGKPLKLIRTRCGEGHGSPGEVIDISPAAMRIACGSGTLEILELQPAGKRIMSAADFLRGTPLQPGDLLG